MKFSAAIAAVTLAGAAVADAMTIRGNTATAQGLMEKSRRIQQDGYYYNNGYFYGQNGQQGGQGGQNGQNMQNYYAEMDDDSMWFLADFSIKLLTCIQGEQVVNYQEADGQMESSTVVFRLCPADSCNTTASEFGCDAGYGDFAVGINTFVQAFLESQREIYGDELVYYNAMGEEFNVNEYAECREYEVQENQYQNGQNGYYNNGQNGYYQQNGQQQQQQQNGQQQAYENYNNNANQNGDNRKLQNNNYNQWYIGPGCTSDGKDIRFALFRDQYCTYSPGTTMKEIDWTWQNGMPFEDGGLINNECHACMVRDQDYNAAITSLCADPFRSALSRCEANMTTWSYMGPNNNGCDYITNLEYSIYGDAIYGTTDETSEEVEEEEAEEQDHTLQDLQDTALRFMDKMNTRQTRAFIAAMVLFSVGACIGATLISCMCFKRRRARKRAKALIANKDVYGGKSEPNPLIKPKTSMVDLVRSSSKRVSNAVASAAVGTQVAVTTAAAGVVAAVTRSSSKRKATTETSEYTNMEDDIEKMPTEGSYKAPAADVASVKSAISKKSVASVKTSTSTKSNKSIPETISTQKPAEKEVVAEEDTPKPAEEETEVKKPATESSGGLLEWFGLSNGSVKEAEKAEDSKKAEEEAEEGSASAATPSVSTNDASSKKDLASQMDDYLSQKFT